jgi:uncharacterized protein
VLTSSTSQGGTHHGSSGSRGAGGPGGAAPSLDLSRIAQDLQIRKVQVESVVQLLDEGNTIPFITRYRKERTGGLNEEVLRLIQERVAQLRQLADRKQTILRSIEGQGRLTPELRAAILAADNPKRLEDLYLPYKPKKRTLATAAREKGLEPLALAIWGADPVANNLGEVLPHLVNPERELNTPEDVLLGVQHILAEVVAESADVRAVVRAVMWDTGRLCTTKSDKLAEGQGLDYKDYFAFTEPVRHIPPHRILAINRGEKENALQVKLEWDAETGQREALMRLPLPVPGSINVMAGWTPETHRPPEAPAAPPVAPSAEGTTPPVVAEAPTAAPSPPPEMPAPAPEGATPVPEAASVSPAPPPSGEEQQAPVPEAVAGSPAEIPPPAQPEGAAPTERHEPSPAAAPKTHAPAPGPLVTAEVLPLPQRAEALQKHPHADFLRQVTADALARLLVPSLEREIRRELTIRSENHAVSVFARNLRSKLMAAPLRGRRVLAIDPGFRTGCKLAVLDEIGNLLAEGVVFPHSGANKRNEAKARLEEMVRRFQVQVIAIGNGTACRETEEIVSDLIASLEARRRGEMPAPTPAPAGPTETPAPPPAPAPEAAAAPEQPVPAPAPTIEATPPPEAAAPPAPAPEPAPEAAQAVAPEASAPAPEAQAPAAPPVPEAPVAPEAAAVPAPPPAPPAEPLPEAPPELAYVIVNEAGASVYSTSPVGKEEFPGLDATLRGTISIGRRLQDPLSELVKIDPQHVGVGLYQHDVNPRHLRESLDDVVESCVNAVGVDLNTASVPLLRHVSGLNQLVARDLVEHRKQQGPFRSREQLLQVPGIGEARFTQAAGFLKIGGGDNPLDGTWIHPESYAVARQLLADLGYEPEALRDRDRLEELREKLRTIPPEEVANRLHAGLPTVRDIIDALARPGRDPREDLPPPVFKKGILKLEDLQPGMELKGTVLNVVDFGAFIDIGLKDSGLVHISQMANRYVKSTYDVVSVGDVVNVWVLGVDKERHRVSLTMIPPGTERRPPEKRPAPRREREPAAAGTGERPAEHQGERPGGRPPRGGGRRPPQQGGGDRGARRLGQRPAPAGAAQSGGPAPARGGPPPRPQPQQHQHPPRKPRRQPPKPNLSQAALAGATPLGTFAELAAFWEAKKKEEPEPVPPVPPAENEEGTPPPA